MNIQENVSLSDFTFFGTGGKAQKLITIENPGELHDILSTCEEPLWFLGSGANVLVSDEGLMGTTIHLITSFIEADNNIVIADSGVEWDELVQKSIGLDKWGLERTSGIPGSVGAAVVGNIAAYGNAVSDSLVWVEVIDTLADDTTPKKLLAEELGFSYRFSNFQTNKFKNLLITRVAFQLSSTPKPLEYASALKVAKELGLNPDNLKQRRDIIMESRRRIGSLIEKDVQKTKTAGSFFRNPEVSEKQAELIMGYEERNVSHDEIKQQNIIHGGSSKRVSAAHVLLAAGFKRGQSWGAVRLHPDHILKVENTGGASSQDIYNVAQEIMTTVHEKLGVTLIPEVRFLGNFT